MEYGSRRARRELSESEMSRYIAQGWEEHILSRQRSILESSADVIEVAGGSLKEWREGPMEYAAATPSGVFEPSV